LTVPAAASATVPWTPSAQLDGEKSSLAQAGLDPGVTLEKGDAGSDGGPSSRRGVSELLARRRQTGQRYLVAGEIARGGMGAVLRVVDGDLHREVAVKYLLDEKDPRKKARFIEEAQIHGQLEHPNIVPVYDLKLDPQTRPYLLMKLVKGRDLKSVLEDLRGTEASGGRKSPDAQEWTLGRLLNVLVNICNGLAFAHAHGVVHRDLKPANIMLGDFGEVYIMDWGLAKVLASGVASAPRESPAGLGALTQPRSPERSSKVVIDREPEADLTQEGSILGTPLYMPPEQAMGRIEEIDERSDIYSLGAILYEMLTLEPPVDKEGGYPAILMRVATGEIVPPEKRVKLPLSPSGERAGVRGRSGRLRNPARHVPPELSAIAMKALAKEKERRYQSVAEFRRDIERFQEGRSVSARRDSFGEQLWKLAKRNKGASLATAAALVVLLVVVGIFLWINNNARVRAEHARKEAEAARKQADANYASFQGAVKKSVGPLLRSAQLHLRDREYDKAYQDVKLARLYDGEHAEARLLKAQLLLVRQEYGQARELLVACCRHDPKNQAARELLDACGRLKPNDETSLVLLAEMFNRQQQYALADGVLAGLGRNPGEAREKLLALYRQRLEKALGQDAADKLTLNAAGQFSLNLSGWKTLDDLTPLQGMPLTSLNLAHCGQVRDLTPLQGMPLTWLDLAHCGQVRDLTPLQGMPLTWLNLTACGQVRDLTPLKGMPLTWLSLGGCGQVRDLTPLAGMPLTWLDLGGCGQVRDLTPLKGMKLERIVFSVPIRFEGLAVLREMPSLKTVVVYPGPKTFPVEEFWKRYDAEEFAK
jgi:serine/threonine protein kinase